MINHKLKNNILGFTPTSKSLASGFTLVELIIAVSLFTIIAFFSIGAVLSIFDANRKARSSKTVMDNFNFAVENMVREIRFGTNYYCGESSDISATLDCSNGGSSISVTFNGVRVSYKIASYAIQKKVGTGSYENITSSDTKVEDVKFYVYNSGSADHMQPYVIAVVRGYVGDKLSSQTKFSIETLISQRKLDL